MYKIISVKESPPLSQLSSKNEYPLIRLIERNIFTSLKDNIDLLVGYNLPKDINQLDFFKELSTKDLEEKCKTGKDLVLLSKFNHFILKTKINYLKLCPDFEIHLQPIKRIAFNLFTEYHPKQKDEFTGETIKNYVLRNIPKNSENIYKQFIYHACVDQFETEVGTAFFEELYSEYMNHKQQLDSTFERIVEDLNAGRSKESTFYQFAAMSTTNTFCKYIIAKCLPWLGFQDATVTNDKKYHYKRSFDVAPTRELLGNPNSFKLQLSGHGKFSRKLLAFLNSLEYSSQQIDEIIQGSQQALSSQNFDSFLLSQEIITRFAMRIFYELDSTHLTQDNVTKFINNTETVKKYLLDPTQIIALTMGCNSCRSSKKLNEALNASKELWKIISPNNLKVRDDIEIGINPNGSPFRDQLNSPMTQFTLRLALEEDFEIDLPEGLLYVVEDGIYQFNESEENNVVAKFKDSHLNETILKNRVVGMMQTLHTLTSSLSTLISKSLKHKSFIKQLLTYKARVGDPLDDLKSFVRSVIQSTPPIPVIPAQVPSNNKSWKFLFGQDCWENNYRLIPLTGEAWVSKHKTFKCPGQQFSINLLCKILLELLPTLNEINGHITTTPPNGMIFQREVASETGQPKDDGVIDSGQFDSGQVV